MGMRALNPILQERSSGKLKSKTKDQQILILEAKSLRKTGVWEANELSFLGDGHLKGIPLRHYT